MNGEVVELVVDLQKIPTALVMKKDLQGNQADTDMRGTCFKNAVLWISSQTVTNLMSANEKAFWEVP